MKSLTSGPVPRDSSPFSCLDLINSSFTDYRDHGKRAPDRLPNPVWQAWFMARHDLLLARAEPFPLVQLRSKRTQLRSILAEWARAGSLTPTAAAQLDKGVMEASLRYRVRIDPDRGPCLSTEPINRDQAWLIGSVTLSAVALITDHPPQRLKVCGNPDCSWMFFDESLNGSRTYCSPQPCATLMRVRRFRAKQRA
jgi:hypothetical protein